MVFLLEFKAGKKRERIFFRPNFESITSYLMFHKTPGSSLSSGIVIITSVRL